MHAHATPGCDRHASLVRCTTGHGSQVWLKLQWEACIAKTVPFLIQSPHLTLAHFSASTTKVPSHWCSPGSRTLHQGVMMAGMCGVGRYGDTPAMGAQVTADSLAALSGWCWCQQYALGVHNASSHSPTRLRLCWLSCEHACVSGTGLSFSGVHMGTHVGAPFLHSPAHWALAAYVVSCAGLNTRPQPTLMHCL